MRIELEPVGVVRTDADRLPRNFRVSDIEGTLEIEERYAEGLREIEAGQHIVVIFHFHESPRFTPDLLRQTPPHRRGDSSLADGSMGVFGICSPVRPNPVGMSIVEVLEARGTSLRVRGIDMRDGTPILDIKPWLGDGIDRS